MKDILEQASKESLIAFILEHANQSEKFANSVNVCFGEPETDKELRRIAMVLDHRFEDACDYGYSRWGDIDIDVGDIYVEIKQRMEQNHIKLAFAEAELLYRKLLENFEYQHECELSGEAEACLEVMSQIASRAVAKEDKEYIFAQCIALARLDVGADYGADYEDSLLKIAAQLVNRENRPVLESALSEYDNGWREEEFKLIRLDILLKIEGEGEASAFISENLQFPKIRGIALDQAVARKDFAEAERLCIEALSMQERDYRISPWLYKIYSVYEVTNDIAKMTDIAKEIMLSGDIEYYGILKTLLEKQGLWNENYFDLLRKCEEKLFYQDYMEILAKENEFDLLMSQIEQHTEQVYKYGKLLATSYFDRILAIFVSNINKKAEAAYGRVEYYAVCSRIRDFAQAGYQKEALAKIDELKLQYKRKPAFTDELRKIRANILNNAI